MDDPIPRGPRPQDVEPAGLSPVRAFLVVGAALAAIAAMFFATRDATPATTPAGPARSPDYSLSDAEAIAEFERLNDLRIAAYKTRDISLLNEVVAPGSALLRRGEDEIRQLLRDGIVIRSRFTTETVDLITNTPDEIVVRQTELDHPKFVDESGHEVTAEESPRVRVVAWTLRRLGNDWWIFDSKLMSEGTARE